MRMLAAAFLAILLSLATPARAGDSPDACAPDGAEPARVLAVDERFDLLLVDGRIAALAGVAFEPDETVRQALTRSLIGADLRLRAAEARPDRWSRVSVFLFAPAFDGLDAPLASVAETALEAGFARYRPDVAAHACRAAFLDAERRGREAKVGLWADPRRGIVDATDRKAISAAGNGLTIVEGEVTGVGETRGRIYLNFGKIRTVDLAIVVSNRNMSIFPAHGLSPGAMKGRRLRARGLIDRRFGPQMEIGDPDALELVDAGQPAAAIVAKE